MSSAAALPRHSPSWLTGPGVGSTQLAVSLVQGAAPRKQPPTTCASSATSFVGQSQASAGAAQVRRGVGQEDKFPTGETAQWGAVQCQSLSCSLWTKCVIESLQVAVCCLQDARSCFSLCQITQFLR